MLDVIADKSEYFKGVCTVLITSLTHKVVKPKQDVRKHQASMRGGYSGRMIDTKYVTPFLKSNQLTHMEESGWLTRSLEHNSPYNFNYNGKIKDKEVRLAFLTLLDKIENKIANPQHYLDYLLQKLILLRDNNINQTVHLKSAEIAIDDVIALLEQHFQSTDSSGTARLPVLAVYSMYECMMNQVARYQDKSLLKLKSHTTADRKSGDIGDIQINYNSQPFEGVEIKHNIVITAQLIQDAYRKIQAYPVERYYLLSTVEPSRTEKKLLRREITKITREHGCQFIVNGLLTTLRYYLRLIASPKEFLNRYSNNLANDSAVKVQHRQLWRRLIQTVSNSHAND